MPYPVVTVKRPACLNGQTNGKLDASALEPIPGQAGGPTIRLVPPAARAWRAMQAHARAAGHVLKATSASDSYRPYADQERIFRARYTTAHLAGRPSRRWNGATWYQKPGTAAAAVPGTSNHGLGLAVDTGTELDGDAGTEAIDRATLDWLLAHAHDYGFSWELQSEPWHLRYFAGDAIPAAVLTFEHTAPPAPLPLAVTTPGSMEDAVRITIPIRVEDHRGYADLAKGYAGLPKTIDADEVLGLMYAGADPDPEGPAAGWQPHSTAPLELVDHQGVARVVIPAHEVARGVITVYVTVDD